MSREVIEMDWPKRFHLSPGFRAGNLIFTSGNVGRDPLTDKLENTIQSQTKQALENIKNILEKEGASMNDVVKVTVFLPNMNDYQEMNKIYLTYFEEPRPARSCVGVKLANKNIKLR